MIKDKVFPCLYELSFVELTPALAPDPNLPAILLRIHEDFFKQTVINFKNPIVECLLEEFKFDHFSGDFSKDFGFNDVILNNGVKNIFHEFSIKLPEVKKISDEKCDFCKGVGEDPIYPGDQCDFCHGTGKNFNCDWTTADAISASLTVLLRELERYAFDNRTSALTSQLIFLTTSTKPGMDGCSLSAEISISLRHWLAVKKSGKNAIPQMVTAMKSAYYKMMGYRKFDEPYFSMQAVNQGGLIIECPPGGCSMAPNWDELPRGLGYSLYSHACDNPAQQLTLISALAALHDLAKKEL